MSTAWVNVEISTTGRYYDTYLIDHTWTKMKYTMKYIRLTDDSQSFILFPWFLKHVDVALTNGMDPKDVPSAGTVIITATPTEYGTADPKVDCEHGSWSLNINHDEDQQSRDNFDLSIQLQK